MAVGLTATTPTGLSASPLPTPVGREAYGGAVADGGLRVVRSDCIDVRVSIPGATLFAQLKALPWAQIPIGHQARESGHGRRETRTVKAITVTTLGGIGFLHAVQAVRITRTRTTTKSGKTTRETAYLTITCPPPTLNQPTCRNGSAASG